ncbi:MAG: DUF4406 domain-containing protein [Eubacteriales bacterium]|nr:DUF4406 domain-containing protein [Eubacteriales bacterium]
MEQSKTVYLAGAITGDPHYRAKFSAAARELTAAGFIVFSPATLPYPALTYEQYMQIGFAMLDACARLCLLHDWQTSPGAVREKERAEAGGKHIFLYERWRNYPICDICQHNAPDDGFTSDCVECDGRSNFKAAPLAAGGNACPACWCYGCMNIAKCLKNGFSCFACSDKGPAHRMKPKESGICGGYTKEPITED